MPHPARVPNRPKKMRWEAEGDGGGTGCGEKRSDGDATIGWSGFCSYAFMRVDSLEEAEVADA
jgi:hypothetical protein